jgi:phosphotransferase system HPr (HPr) family protein
VPERTVTLINPTGLHARPAKVFARAANGHDATITVAKADADPVNAKSVLSVLTLDGHEGDVVTITVEGDDAERIADELADLVASGLGEPVEGQAGAT